MFSPKILLMLVVIASVCSSSIAFGKTLLTDAVLIIPRILL